MAAWRRPRQRPMPKRDALAALASAIRLAGRRAERWSRRSACWAPIRRRSWPTARDAFESGDLDAGRRRPPPRAAAARDGADDAGRVRVRGRRRHHPAAGRAVPWPAVRAAAAPAQPPGRRPCREPIDLGGPARHLHAALQHGPDRWAAGLLPRLAARVRRRAGRQHHGRHPDRHLLPGRAGALPALRLPVGSATARTGSCRSAPSSAWWRS